MKQKMVTVHVQNPYSLRTQDGTLVQYAAGVQQMPEEHANHAYSKANGVKIHDPSHTLALKNDALKKSYAAYRAAEDEAHALADAAGVPRLMVGGIPADEAAREAQAKVARETRLGQQEGNVVKTDDSTKPILTGTKTSTVEGGGNGDEGKDPEDMTVAELKEALDNAGVEYDADDRKDDLVKLYKKKVK